MTIKTIIAAIALENGDQPVVRRALQLAAEHGARLIWVHAIESLPETGSDPVLPANEGTIAEMLAAEAVAAMKQMAAHDAVQPEIHVERGKADQLIERLIENHAADLLIIGPGKPQNLRERLFGSTADRLVRSGRCPVLVVKRAGNDPYRRVIAGIDFSPMAASAARMAAQLAPEADHELIHALEIPLAFEQAMLKTGTPQAKIDHYRKAKARSAHAQLRTLCSQLSLSGKIRVVRGDPAITMVRLARSAKTDLVALGIQGRNAVSKMVLGSVARRVLAGSSCDVLLTGQTAEPV